MTYSEEEGATRERAVDNIIAQKLGIGEEGGSCAIERHDSHATFHRGLHKYQRRWSRPRSHLWRSHGAIGTKAPTATHAPRAARQPHVSAVQSGRALWRVARTCAARVSRRTSSLSATAHRLHSARRPPRPTSLPPRRRIKLPSLPVDALLPRSPDARPVKLLHVGVFR